MDRVSAPEETLYRQGPFAAVVLRPEPRKEQIVVRSPDAVHILPITVDNKVVLLRQPRYGAGCWVLEAPAGGIDAGETPVEAARRELREELGYGCDDLVRVGTPGAFSSPGLLAERSTLFVARGCRQETDDHEQIARVELTPDEALALIAAPGTDAAPAADPQAVVADVKTMLVLVLARAARLL